MAAAHPPLVDAKVAAAVCMALTDTLRLRRFRPRERLTDFGRLLAWSVQVGTITAPLAERLGGAGLDARAAATAVRAQGLREAFYRVVEAIVTALDPPREDIALLNREFSEAMSHLRLVWRDGVFATEWAATSDPAQVLWPVAQAAAAVLTTAAIRSRIRLCANAACGRLIIDTTKGGNRRWCDMSKCGNRAKARRHYERIKEQRLASPGDRLSSPDAGPSTSEEEGAD